MVCLSSIVRHQQFLLTSSPPKPLGQFETNLAGMFLGRSSLKLVSEFDSIKKSGCYDNQMEFSKQFLKKICETAGQILK